MWSIMTQPSGPARQRLAAVLRRLREDAGLSTYALAEVLGWSQSRVTRIENARITAAAADAEAWANATGAPPRIRDELSDLAYDAWTQSRSWRASHRRGLATRQREIGQLERAAARVRHFQPEAIPGTLQSPSYARHLITMADVTQRGDVDEAVAARMERQRILREPGRKFEYILAEGALRWRPGPPEVMTEQREHLLVAAQLTSVTLAIIPFDQQARVPYIHPFIVYDVPDAPMVLAEQYTGEVFVSDARDIALYERTFDQLRDSALIGDDALEFIRSAIP
jgi:transcriptional regulator with XRE-family HTH domain